MFSDDNKDPHAGDEEIKHDDLDNDDLDEDLDDLDDDDDLSDDDLDEDLEEAPKEGKDGEQDEKDKQIATLNAQRKKFRERAKKAEEALAALKNKGSDKEDKPSAQKKAEGSGNQERLDFRFDHQDLSTKEVQEIEAFAKAKDVSLERAYKSSLIQTWLAKRRRQQKTEEAAPINRRRGSAAPPKGKNPNEMTDEEFDAYTRRVKEKATR